MMRTLGRMVMAAVAVLTVTVSMATDANAFCIYNYTSHTIWFQQHPNADGFSAPLSRGFSARLAPGASSCCNWENRDCNPGRKRDSTVYMNYGIYMAPNVDIHNYRCPPRTALLSFQAGGWVEVYNAPPPNGIACAVFGVN
ncbi:hypothetical protein ACM64Y_08270 [Novispirillum sp. DQ9]|uniref:hypothetical protein n=1 Tax=Novispirillum sp. DQ9 TaxID=3398612 RepID=UPI003C7BFD64